MDYLKLKVDEMNILIGKLKGMTDAIGIRFQYVQLESGRQRSIYCCRFPSTGGKSFGFREAVPRPTGHDVPDVVVSSEDSTFRPKTMEDSLPGLKLKGCNSSKDEIISRIQTKEG